MRQNKQIYFEKEWQGLLIRDGIEVVAWGKTIAQRVELQTIQRKDKHAKKMTGKPFVLLYSQDKP